MSYRDAQRTRRGRRTRKPGVAPRITLAPFGIAWYRTGDTEPFLQDRRTQAYFASRKTGAFAHYLERRASDRHYGLGDKSGPLDRTGRRFRMDAVDPCGFDAETSDPLYKMIPFYIVSGENNAHGIYYDNLATGEIDLGCTLDNYHTAPTMATWMHTFSPAPTFHPWSRHSPGSPAARLCLRDGRWASR
jgi:alpha-glucosidase